MKVTRLRTRLVEVPFDKPIKTAIHDMRSVGCVLVMLETDQGLVGESYVFTLNAVRLGVLRDMIESFRHHVESSDPHKVDAIWQGMWDEMNPIGHAGFTVAALTAVDVACWDLVGKAAGQPLHRVFGSCRDRVPTYASGGLWLSMSIDELLEQATGYVEEGFRAMKIRLGSPDVRTDVDRFAAVRAAIGDEIELLSDANQCLTADHAIELGRELAPYQPGWFEEPVAYHDLEGHRRIRQALETPIASGETAYTALGMRDILNAEAVDVLMPDLQRIGGYSEFRRSASLAAAHNVPVSSHIFTEHSLCLAGTIPNCISVEHMPWVDKIFNEKMELKNGELVIPDRPGTGFTFNPDAVEMFAI